LNDAGRRFLERRLTGAELSAIAERLAASKDPVETLMLREEIAR
jgi:hypothetical protein